MIDDCLAGKYAINEVWHLVTQLYSLFHFLQSKWRWLISAGSNIKPTGG